MADYSTAIIVLEREMHAVAEMERTLKRQLEVFPPDSRDYRGAKTALDVARNRISALKAGIKALNT